MTDPMITIALPKGRIAEELAPVLKRIDLQPEDAYFDPASRQLSFATSRKDVQLIRVRSFDVATFVSYGAAQIGVCGSDVLAEHDYPNLYSPLDLAIGKCRLSLAAPVDFAEDEEMWNASHIRVATKYTHLTQQFFAAKGIQAECIKLNGAIELAPILGLCRRIVDLVSTGGTLKANGLKEVEVIQQISSRLIINRPGLKTMGPRLQEIINGFTNVIEDKDG